MQVNWKEKVDQEHGRIDFSKHKYKVRLETSKGNLTLDLFPDVAPNHCKNLISLSRLGFYDGLSFHRVVKGFVIQGGCPSGNGTGGPGFRVAAEFNNNSHKFGALSMARTQDPDSAGSQFFVCLEKIPYLDGQYTVFGQLADEGESAETLRAIGTVETGRGDVPVDRVSIYKAHVLET